MTWQVPLVHLLAFALRIPRFYLLAIPPAFLVFLSRVSWVLAGFWLLFSFLSSHSDSPRFFLILQASDPVFSVCFFGVHCASLCWQQPRQQHTHRMELSCKSGCRKDKGGIKILLFSFRFICNSDTIAHGAQFHLNYDRSPFSSSFSLLVVLVCLSFLSYFFCSCCRPLFTSFVVVHNYDSETE